MHSFPRRLAPVASLLLAFALIPGAAAAQQRVPNPLQRTLPRPARPDAQRQAEPVEPGAEREPAPAPADDERRVERRQAFNNRNVPIKLDFDRVDIVDVIKTISDITGRNFILPDNVRGKITIISPTAVTPDQAYSAFLAALEANNLTVYPVGRFLKVIPKKDAQRSNVPTVMDDTPYPWNEQMVTRVFRLQHVEVDAVNNIMKTLVSRDGEVQTSPPDLLIVTDVGLNLHRIEKIVAQIDQAGGSDEIRILQVRYAAAGDIADKLMQIFEGQSGGAARTTARPSTARRVRRPPVPNQPSQENELEVTISRVIADERTNKLIVIADEKSFRQIENILAQLDVPTEGEGQVHVHYLNNANAEELATTLSQLAEGGGGTQTAGRPRTPTPRAARGGDTAGAGGATAAELFEGEVRITADKGTNSLVIVSSYNDYKSLARVIERLDFPRRQVFVEAVIMEVSLDTSKELGLTFHQGSAPTLSDGNVAPVIVGTQLGGLNSLSLSGLLSFGGFLAGIQGPPVTGTEGLPISIPSFGVVLQALQRDSNVNVLSTPHILTSDNEEAEITVGQNVPFQAGYTTPGIQNLLGGGTTTGTNGTDSALSSALLGGFGGLGGGLGSFYAPIQRQNVELRLKIKPQINESDYVRLQIEEQTEEIAATDPQLGPTTSRRTAKTTVVARDGRTVVIGGLIQERKIESVQKVPVLGDIPVLGWLFRSSENQTIKTNLLLFLTPYIIKSDADFTRIFRQKLEERERFVEQFYGTDARYVAELDFNRKRGPFGEITNTLREERLSPENGGPGRDVRVITPGGPDAVNVGPAPRGGGATEGDSEPEAAPADEGLEFEPESEAGVDEEAPVESDEVDTVEDVETVPPVDAGGDVDPVEEVDPVE